MLLARLPEQKGQRQFLKMRTTLITGASSGIGLELAKVCAAAGERLVLVARSREKLELLAAELRNQHQTEVHIIVADLSRDEAPDEVFEETEKLGLVIDHLVNNAGFGHRSDFSDTDPVIISEMMHVNMVALVKLCRLYLPGMLQRKYGRLLNVSSTAAFAPGPEMALYYASKAFVLSFGEALWLECKGTGVTVTTLCPGPTNSDFHRVANTEKARLMNSTPLPSSASVAAYGYRAMMRGQRKAVHLAANKIMAFLMPLTPNGLLMRIIRWLHRN